MPLFSVWRENAQSCGTDLGPVIGTVSKHRVTMTFLAEITAVVGPAQVLTDPADMASALTDWRGRYHGKALAVVRPGSTAEVADVVRTCARHAIAIAPQGGNTGMCGAATPLGARDQIVLRLDRMNRVRGLSRLGDSISVDAGCILANIQEAAAAADRLFPLSLGAEGSCQIGGNLSTNAGGTAVLRYGTTRDLTLGLEVVLPDGQILDLMTRLRKDSTAYDLKQLFIGAEGTLGIITGAVLKLFPRPQGRAVALAKVDGIEAVLDLLALARSQMGDRLGAFEVMSRSQLELIGRHMPQVAIPFAVDSPWVVLIEVSDTLAVEALPALLEQVLADAVDRGLIGDALVASSETQAQALWKIRHSVSEASKKQGYVVSHDSAVPLDRQGDFVTRIEARLRLLEPEAVIAMHGHVGDGNIHVLAILPQAATGEPDTLARRVSAINMAVDEETAALGGSISAEHGIGVANLARLARVTPAAEMTLLRQIKGLIDPAGMMNPGKLLTPEP